MTFEERVKEYLEQDTKATKELHEAYEKEKAEKEYKKLRLATMYGIFALPDDYVLKQELVKACADRIAKVLSEHKAVYIDTDALVKATEGMEDTIEQVTKKAINGVYGTGYTGGLHLDPENRIKKLQELNETLFSKVAELNQNLALSRKQSAERAERLEAKQNKIVKQAHQLEHLGVKVKTLQAQFDNADQLLTIKQKQCVELLKERDSLEERLRALSPFESTIEELKGELQERNEKIAQLYCENKKLKDMIARMRENIKTALNTPYNEEKGGYDE